MQSVSRFVNRLFNRTYAVRAGFTLFLCLTLSYYSLGDSHWYLWLVLAALAAPAWIFSESSSPHPPGEKRLSHLFWVASGLALLQVIPLPLFLLRVLSPAKAELAGAVYNLSQGSYFASLSVQPALGWEQLVRLGGYFLVFLTVSKLYHRLKDWSLVFAILVAAAIEAAIGVVQYLSSPVLERAHGTLVNPNHFSAYLEMALPFAFMLSALHISRWRTSEGMRRVRSAAAATVGALVSALLLLAIANSVSRVGLLAALGSLALCGILLLPKHLSNWKRIGMAAGVILAAAVAVLILAPARLVTRMAGASDSPNALNDHLRLGMWRDTLRMITDYPLFGVGLGAFRAAFLRYQTADLEHSVIYSHNDYLQLTAEAGVVGLVVVLLSAVLVFRMLVHSVTEAAHRHDRMLAIACTGSLAAIALHSFFDFNLYVAPVAILAATVAGMSVGLYSEVRRRVAPEEPPSSPFIRNQALALASFMAAYSVIALLVTPRLLKHPALERATCRIGLCADDQLTMLAYSQLNNERTRPAAIQTFETLLNRNPASPFAWLDIAQADLFENRAERADSCVRRAVMLAPNHPLVWLRTANYYASRGQRKLAVESGQHILSAVGTFDPVVFQMQDTMRITVPEVTGSSVFPGCRGARAYFYSVTKSTEVQHLSQVWDWLGSHRCADNAVAVAYVDAILGRGDAAAASAAWNAFAGPILGGNLVRNGDFEKDPSGSRFDWRVLDGGQVQLTRNPGESRAGSGALRVSYNGEADPQVVAISQSLYLAPGEYRLEADIRRQDIPSDQGIGVRLVDPAAKDAILVSSDRLTGSADWETVRKTFRVTGSARVVEVQIARMRAEIALSTPSGSAWIDNVKVVREIGP